ADLNHHLTPQESGKTVTDLIENGRIECVEREIPILRFIQLTHDTIVSQGRNGIIAARRLRAEIVRQNVAEVPSCLSEFFGGLLEINRETYTEIMQRIGCS